MKLTLIQIKLGVTVVQASLYSMGIMNLTPWEALEDLKSTTHARFLTDDEINEERPVSYYISLKWFHDFRDHFLNQLHLRWLRFSTWEHSINA